MAKVTEVLDRAARACSVTTPASWITDTSVAITELRDDFLHETIAELQKRIDWSSPIGKQTTITGTGGQNYNLPADFVRLMNDDMAVYETTTTRRAGVPVNSDGAWTYLTDMGTAGGSRYYRVKGYEGNYTIDLYREPAASDSITVHYVSNIWMKSSAGVEGKVFSDADDVVLYPRRILELGVIWRFRKRKGLPFADILAEYEGWIATEVNRMRGRGPINFGAAQVARNPMSVPVPDFIPSS